MSYAGQWYAYLNGQVQGPYPPEAIAAMARSGVVTPETPLCGDGRTYAPARQAFPQFFGAPPVPAGPRAPALPPMAGAPSAARSKALPVALGLAAGALVMLVVLVLLLSGGGPPGAGLLAELPAGTVATLVDLDAAGGADGLRDRELSDAAGLPEGLGEKLLAMLPKGRRGVVAAVFGERDVEPQLSIHQPRALRESAFIRLLEENGYERDRESLLRVWLPRKSRGPCVALHRGRIYSGSAELVKNVIGGALASERTFAHQRGCRELIRELASSAAVLLVHSGPESFWGAPPGTVRPDATAAEETVSGSRSTLRFLWQCERSEDAARMLEELQRAQQELESRLGGARFAEVRSGWKFERLVLARTGNVVTLTATYRRSGP